MSKLLSVSLFLLAALLPIQNWLLGFLIVRLHWPEWVSLWKELLVGVLLIYFLLTLGIEWIGKKVPFRLSLTWPLLLVVGITGLILISSFWVNQIPLAHFLWGFRFELWWLWLFAVTSVWLQHFPLDRQLLVHLTKAIYLGFLLCSLLTVASLIWGQQTVSNFWQSKTSVKQEFKQTTTWARLNQNCHVIDYGIDNCRLAGPFSTPNHLAAYLLLVLPVFLVNFRLTWKQQPWKPETRKTSTGKWLLARFIWEGSAIALIISFIALSYARFAWLVMLTFVSVMTINYLKQRWLPKTNIFTWLTKVGLTASLLIPILIAVVAINLTSKQLKTLPLPTELIKPSSTSLHTRHTAASLTILANNPDKLWLGWGLPVAGPAAKQEYIDHYQNPMVMANSQVAYNYGLLPPDLAVPENWFLQLLFNGGLVYFLAYSALVSWPLVKTWWQVWQEWSKATFLTWANLVFGLSFFGIILGNLLLHLWENQTVAIYWTITWLYYFTLTNLKIDFTT